MKLLAALSAAASLALPVMAGAQGYPSYAVASQASVKGTISGFNGAYTVFVQDDKGYTDNVQMHDGTVINPTGIRLQEGMRVTIYGYANGSVFQAYRIDTQYPANYGYGGYPGYGYGGYGYGGYGYGYPYGGYGYGYGYPYGYGGYGYGSPWYPFWGIGIGWWGGGWGGWGWPGYYGCCFTNTVFFRGPIVVRRPGFGGVHGQVGAPVRGGMGAPVRGGGMGAPIHGNFGAPVRGGMGAPVRGGGMTAPVHGSFGGGRPPRR